MTDNDLASVVEIVVQQAEQNGFVLPTDVRTALSQAGLEPTRWKEVVALAGTALRRRNGRYYHSRGVSQTVRREQQQQRKIRRAVRELVRDYRSLRQAEDRRQHRRTDFIQLVRVHTEAGATFTLLSRDLSANGIRLLGTRRLLGQKLRLEVAQPGELEGLNRTGTPRWTFAVRILWTCAVGDDLFENGGTFLDVEEQNLSEPS